jgi:hypothetical protein
MQALEERRGEATDLQLEQPESPWLHSPQLQLASLQLALTRTVGCFTNSGQSGREEAPSEALRDIQRAL